MGLATILPPTLQAVPSGVAPGPLADARGRIKRKLRLSVTDRCQFRCAYCLPARPTWLPKAELLSADELLRLARLAVQQGITHLRLTGGEPLLRPELPALVERLQALRALGLERLSMTTNAARLAPLAERLKAAGLDDLNISLDAIDPKLFEQLTGHALGPVLEGIEAARAAGLPVKLNAVLLKGRNESQILPLADWALARGLPLRFIEVMPLDAPGRWRREDVVAEAEILAVLRGRYTLEPLPRGSDPAQTYRVAGGGEIGVIATITNPFCGACDRLRLTATGELFTCLFAATGTPLGRQLRAGATDEALVAALRAAVWRKPAGYAAQPGRVERTISMHALGG